MGFAAEIKEFLGSAKDTYKLMSDVDAKSAQSKYYSAKAAETEQETNDPLNRQLKEAKLAHMQATTGQIGKARPLNEYQKWVMGQANAPSKPSPILGSIPDDDQGGAVSASKAIGGAEPNKPPPETYDIPKPVRYGFLRGGLVRKFQEGGMVEDEDLEDDEGLPQEVTPAVGPAAAPTGGGYDVGARAVMPTPAIGVVPTPRPRPKLQQVLSDGLKYGLSEVEGAGAVGPARTRAQRGIAAGAGAAPANEMLQIYKKIDPTGKKYTEGERNLVALQIIHDYKMRAQDPEGAARTAFQMMQHFKTAQSQYGQLAAAAMKGGHVDAGIKLALKQYANVPDGNEMQMWQDPESGRIGWEMKDAATGNRVAGGLATPEEIGSNAAKLAAPGGYENYLANMMSGGRIRGDPGGAPSRGRGGKAEGPQIGASKAMDPAKFEKLEAQVNEHVDKWVTADAESPEGKRRAKAGRELKPSEIAAMKNSVLHIRANSGMTNDEALRTFQDFVGAPATYEGGGRERPIFTVDKSDPNVRVLRMADGRTVSMPTSDYAPMAAARGQALRDAEKAANEPEKEGYTPKFERAGQAAGAIGSELVRPVKEAYGNLGANPAGLIGAVVDLPMRAGRGAIGTATAPLAQAGRAALGAVRRPEEEVPGVDSPL
jgi:hypothetical protein